ncbi:MAG: cytochrome b561 domain-containing protein [Geminicoccaceae bacterium]
MDPFLLHGFLMAVAWLVLLPIGVLIARFFKVTKTQDWPNELDNQFWWRSHRWLNYSGIGMATLGILVVWTTLDGLQFSTWHGRLGLATFALGWLQVISAWLRGTTGGPKEKGADPDDPRTWRGDHFDMTLRRRLFEGWHKHLGYLALMLAVPTAWLGLHLLAMPVWLKAAPWIAGLIFVLLYARFAREGRWIDTHEAIWGPDMSPSSQPDRQKKREAS